MKLTLTHDCFQGTVVRHGTEDELMELVDFLLDHVTQRDYFASEKSRWKHIALDEDELRTTCSFEGYGIRIKLED